ncbi:hypothetical protein [Aquimarina litoralis]|uniref:hypothetical protein n=1 Tax=Aquimarina litoralis TaxID=584605 RepID=UPI001C5A2D3B|nr:hypothetical protein [Aquimarina litoralis]MBW1294153.1 hypothetical protein [Aquimarina litoralis]
MKQLHKGDFVKVGNDIGVIVAIEGENNIPIDHLGIWYGEKNDLGNPKYRTVPAEYCEKTTSAESYH